ncbi:hypothetical protein BDP55DRAFT_371612 [Colletotrichum godetiae]|uniref:Uncharacterized protein n=1 Tax=Colletotrichum godetiae TaxID=1209918 RepID=A0AAJ0A9B7_9PEZI|nr:uncharacterized protein BDP55DRAFT_371612 [Colletotrichum godetiae]KAK1658918.1 hypothetical protein BDP55DRAFT_371612 [Colletotrichum godetiae]
MAVLEIVGVVFLSKDVVYGRSCPTPTSRTERREKAYRKSVWTEATWPRRRTKTGFHDVGEGSAVIGDGRGQRAQGGAGFAGGALWDGGVNKEGRVRSSWGLEYGDQVRVVGVFPRLVPRVNGVERGKLFSLSGFLFSPFFDGAASLGRPGAGGRCAEVRTGFVLLVRSLRVWGMGNGGGASLETGADRRDMGNSERAEKEKEKKKSRKGTRASQARCRARASSNSMERKEAESETARNFKRQMGKGARSARRFWRFFSNKAHPKSTQNGPKVKVESQVALAYRASTQRCQPGPPPKSR